MATLDDLAFLDATAQAELVRQKEVKPIELVEAAIARIERLNPTLNAVITPMYELARTAADEKLPEGPFTGVPFLLKDILGMYAGVRMTLGSKLLQDFVPDHDSELVARFKRAGLLETARLCSMQPRDPMWAILTGRHLPSDPIFRKSVPIPAG